MGETTEIKISQQAMTLVNRAMSKEEIIEFWEWFKKHKVIAGTSHVIEFLDRKEKGILEAEDIQPFCGE